MSTKKHRSHKVLWLLIAVVVVGLILGGYLRYHKSASNSNVAVSSASKVQGTKSTPEAPQPATDNTPNNTGGATSQNVTTTSLPPSSDWVSSSNGDITLQEPSSGTVFESGDAIVGLAKVSTVQFILTDNAVGLIAQGNLNVINGKFSSTIQFTPHSNSGNLEVYYPNPSNGAEEDIVNIDVNFST